MALNFIGDYRARWMSHDGTNRPQSPFRSNSAIGSAKANMYDSNRHSFEQRLRLASMHALMSLQTSKL